MKYTGKNEIRNEICFGMGDFAVNGMFTFVSTYLLYFYTDVARMGLGVVSAILVTGRIVDACSCLIAGRIVDRTESRIGKCRPIIIAGALPLGVLLSVLFYVPAGESSVVILYCYLIYIAFSICYSLVNVPYSTLLSLVSEDNNVRIQYNIFKIFGANTGGLLVTAFTMDIIHRMGGETIGNYFKTAGVYGVIGIAGLLLCGIGVKEIKRKPTPGNMSFHTSCRVAAENPHWILFCIVMFLSMFYMILHNQGTIYYTKYYLNDTSLSSVILTMTPLASAIMSFLMPKMTERYGIRKVMLAGNLIMISSLFGTWFAGKNRVLVLLMSAATSVGWAIAMGMVFVTIPQLIDYSEWKTGYRPQGFMTSVVTFLMKMGVAFAGFLSPFILSLGGYHAGDRLSQNAIKAILADYIFLPALLSVLVMILMFFYGLDKLYPQISEQLKLKK